MNQVRIITELEKEKKKMQDDVQKLKDAKVRVHLYSVLLVFLFPLKIALVDRFQLFFFLIKTLLV